jgi:hypothetical protein
MNEKEKRQLLEIKKYQKMVEPYVKINVGAKSL